MDFTRFVDVKKLLAECEIPRIRLDKGKYFRVRREDDYAFILIDNPAPENLTTDNIVEIIFLHRHEQTAILDELSHSGTVCFVRSSQNTKDCKNIYEFIFAPITSLQIKGITLSEEFMGMDKYNSIQALTEDFITNTDTSTYMVAAIRNIEVGSKKATSSFTFVGISGDREIELHCGVERNEEDSPYIVATRKNTLQNKDKYSFILAETGGTIFTSEREIERRKTIERIEGKQAAFLNIWRSYCYEQYKSIIQARIDGGFLKIESYDGNAFTTHDDGDYTFHNFINVLKKSKISDCYLLHANEDMESKMESLHKLIADKGNLEEEEILKIKEAVSKGTNITVSIKESIEKGKIVLDTSKRREISDQIRKAEYIMISGHMALRNLDIQEREFARVMEGQCAMPHLTEILLGIGGVNEVQYRGEKKKKTHLDEIIKYFPFEPTLTQIKALQIALETPDIAIIHGPPGTGKSAIIRALIKGIEKYEKPLNGTLLTTYQHDALDNLMSKAEVNGLPCLRYGGKDDASANILSMDMALEISKKAKALEEKYPGYKQAGLLHRLKNSIAALDYMQLSFGNVKAYIEQILEYTRDYLTNHSRKALERIKAGIEAKINMQDDPTLAATVDKLRVHEVAFNDDGELNIILAEGRLIFENEDVKNMFEDYKTAARKGDFESARSIRLRLIASVTAQKKPCLTSKDKEELREVLLEAVSGIEDSLAARGDLEEEIISDYINTYKNNYGETLYAIKKYNKHIGVTHYQLDNKLIAKHVEVEEFENVIVDEAARSSPMDLLVVMSRASKRIILVGDHHQLPQYKDKKIFEQAVTEMKKKEIVYSNTDTGIDSEDIADYTLFEKLIDVVKRMSEKDGIERYVMLTDQYRSPDVLGDFVSRQFYGNKLRNGTKMQEYKKFEHGIPQYKGQCAIFKEIPFGNVEFDDHESRYRKEEAVWIAEDVKKVLSTCKKGTSIGIMSFYNAQCKEIEKQLAKIGVMAKSENGEDYFLTVEYQMKDVIVYVGTVDSYQGKEFDIVYLSVTVAPNKGGIGFLSSGNRRCVALSRAKKLLIVVGDPKMAAKIPDIKAFRELCSISAEGKVSK